MEREVEEAGDGLEEDDRRVELELEERMAARRSGGGGGGGGGSGLRTMASRWRW